MHFAALLQADATISNFLIQEAGNLESFDTYVDPGFRLDGGHINLEDRPGLGIEVKEADIAKLPKDQSMSYRQYRHEDGSWKGW